NRSAVERRAATLPTRRTVKREWQAAWLLRAITCLDLTTLQGDDTPTNVRRLCAKARQPLRPDLVAALGAERLGIRVGAVCVYPMLVPVAAEARAAGAREIDVVITRAHALAGHWEALYDEVRACRAAAGDAVLKVILATGELATLTTVARASQVAMMAGADF